LLIQTNRNSKRSPANAFNATDVGSVHSVVWLLRFERLVTAYMNSDLENGVKVFICVVQQFHVWFASGNNHISFKIN